MDLKIKISFHSKYFSFAAKEKIGELMKSKPKPTTSEENRDVDDT